MKLSVASLLAAVGAATTIADLRAQQQFIGFVKEYNKQYATGEVFKRFNIFKKNLAVIEAHDADAAGYTMAINKFSDLSQEEFKATMGLKPIKETFTSDQVFKADPSVKLADSVDWTTKGVVTPVKNQGNCGSCWSFSTTGSVEGAVALKTSKLISLSEQQLVSCDRYAAGCGGAPSLHAGYQYIIKNKGIGTEESYPYASGAGNVPGCKQVPSVTTISNYKMVPKGIEPMMAAVNQQPISIGVDADQAAFQNYQSGIIRTGCGQSLDHAVLLVGYGTDNGVDYWKVKNSWGSDWGEEGYLRIARGPSDQCGVTGSGQATFPVV